MKATGLLHIGTIERVSLPNDGIENIPAKVDTGADNSAIWASNIMLESGKLTFNFFAPGSTYYREQPVETTAFKTTTVRNSFGHKEFRYKIKLKVQVGSHKSTRWFTLADRSQNTYPILLGKNFLKNKYVVDVSQKYLLSQNEHLDKVAVLGAASAESQEFFAKLAQYNTFPVSYVNSRYDSLLYYFAKQAPHILNVTDNNTDLAHYAFVYFKTHQQHAELAAAVAEYLSFKGVSFVDREVESYSSASKLTEYMKFSCYGLDVPPAVCAATPVLIQHYKEIKKQFGAPFVLKEIGSNKGRNNYLITSEAEFREILSNAPAEHIYLAQKYIENEGFYRIYVLGKEAELAIWRETHHNSEKLKRHLNKPTGSANAHLVPIGDVPGEVQDLAIRAAQCLSRQIAGVDLVQDKHTKKWYILEVNNAPQIRSGSFLEEKAKALARFFDQELHR